MKVMLPVKDGSTLKNEMAESFHNIQFICVYDNNSKTLEWFHSDEISKTQGGLNAGLIKNGIFSIISPSITPMVLNMFNRNGIRVFKAQTINVSTNISLFCNNQLNAFTAVDSKKTSACYSSLCSGCSSNCN
jgi:predicted Fe-Mo cluster-binding NifX family protein